jgi:ComF family protein
MRSPPPFDRSVAAVDYGFPWHDLVAALKFREGLDRAPALACAIVAAVAEADSAHPSLLLPVPLGPARLRSRGFNQAWELARRIGDTLGIAASAHTLVRRFDASSPQSGLRREARIAAPRGAFGVSPDAAAALRGRTVALVDDVMTTGATAAEASRVLLAAGAASVQVWVFARTPAPSGP